MAQKEETRARELIADLWLPQNGPLIGAVFFALPSQPVQEHHQYKNEQRRHNNLPIRRCLKTPHLDSKGVGCLYVSHDRTSQQRNCERHNSE